MIPRVITASRDAFCDVWHRTVTKAIDLRGLSQPFPFLLLHLKLEEIDVGQVVEVITSGSSAEREVDLYCRASGNELLDVARLNDGTCIFVVRKQSLSNWGAQSGN